MLYCLPDLGLEGAGDGGISWPSRSICENAFPKALSLGFAKAFGGVFEELASPDIVAVCSRWRNKFDDL